MSLVSLCRPFDEVFDENESWHEPSSFLETSSSPMLTESLHNEEKSLFDNWRDFAPTNKKKEEEEEEEGDDVSSDLHLITFTILPYVSNHVKQEQMFAMQQCITEAGQQLIFEAHNLPPYAMYKELVNYVDYIIPLTKPPRPSMLVDWQRLYDMDPDLRFDERMAEYCLQSELRVNYIFWGLVNFLLRAHTVRPRTLGKIHVYIGWRLFYDECMFKNFAALQSQWPLFARLLDNFPTLCAAIGISDCELPRRRFHATQNQS